MVNRSVVYRIPTPRSMSTPLHVHLAQGLTEMGRVDALTVAPASYDVLALAVSRLLDSLPAEATVADLRAAILRRALADPTEVA